jgi:hypothetical protein
MRLPKIEFKDQAELDKYLKEWQERLFLTDWIIKAKLVDPAEMPQSLGLNDYVQELKSCIIRISKNSDYHKDEIVKFCQEKVLVHELLHCVFLNLDKPKDIKTHIIVEQIAKSLIMTKYNLPFEWFKNF